LRAPVARQRELLAAQPAAAALSARQLRPPVRGVLPASAKLDRRRRRRQVRVAALGRRRRVLLQRGRRRAPAR
jgi:hypothetical protein